MSSSLLAESLSFVIPDKNSLKFTNERDSASTLRAEPPLTSSGERGLKESLLAGYSASREHV